MTTVLRLIGERDEARPPVQGDEAQEVRKAVASAMEDAWNAICADTGCHPLDIAHQGRKLFFHPGHWAEQTARLLLSRFALPRPQEGWQPIETTPPEPNWLVWTLWDGVNNKAGEPARYYTAAKLDGDSGDWVDEHGDAVDTPTHWRPLPPTPTTQAGGEDR